MLDPVDVELTQIWLLDRVSAADRLRFAAAAQGFWEALREDARVVAALAAVRADTVVLERRVAKYVKSFRVPDRDPLARAAMSYIAARLRAWIRRAWPQRPVEEEPEIAHDPLTRAAMSRIAAQLQRLVEHELQIPWPWVMEPLGLQCVDDHARAIRVRSGEGAPAPPLWLVPIPGESFAEQRNRLEAALAGLAAAERKAAAKPRALKSAGVAAYAKYGRWLYEAKYRVPSHSLHAIGRTLESHRGHPPVCSCYKIVSRGVAAARRVFHLSPVTWETWHAYRSKWLAAQKAAHKLAAPKAAHKQLTKREHAQFVKTRQDWEAEYQRPFASLGLLVDEAARRQTGRRRALPALRIVDPD